MRLHAQVLLAVALFASPAHAQITGPVGVDGGQISGHVTSHSAIQVFRGIPFAAPPVGDLRWKPPQPVRSWKGVRSAEKFAPDCPQLRGSSSGRPGAAAQRAQSEDCLYLNVWTGAQSANEKRPVMVWIYGGGYRAGSAAMPAYDGENLAKRGVVFVSISYRVGPLGFMAHPELSAESPRRVSGNYGIHDQIAALDWVRRNIASFGGDPDRITILGQSAGSMSTSYLASSPLATGKFHRLIGQTGAGFGVLAPEPLAAAEEKGVAFGKALGAETAEQLRALDADTLVQAAGYQSGTFQPINDGWVVPGKLSTIYREGRQNDVAMLIGSNADEEGENQSLTLDRYMEELTLRYGDDAEALLALHPASNDAEARASARRLGTLTLGDYTMHSWARAQMATGTAPIYYYRFTHHPPVPPAEYPGGPEAAPPGAWHGAEIPYVLDNLESRDWPWSSSDRILSERLASYWVNFAATGDPNSPDLPRWPTLQEEPGKVMELGDNLQPVARPGVETLEILERHLGKSEP